MRERGIVVKHDESGIEVQMQQGFNCDGCSACFLDTNKRHVLHLTQDIEVNPGEQVEVEVHPGYAIKSAFLLFLLPLLMLIGGYYFFDDIFPFPGISSQYGGITGALFSFVGTYIFIFLYDRRLKNAGGGENVRIVRIFQDQEIK